jgi:hypothetical protein
VAKDAPSKGEEVAASGDVAFIYAKDQNGLHIVRRRSEDAPVETAVIQPLAEGRPITGEVISLHRRVDWPLLFNVKTEIEPAEHSPAGKGPPQVTTDSYRDGWDAVFGRKRIGPRDMN